MQSPPALPVLVRPDGSGVAPSAEIISEKRSRRVRRGLTITAAAIADFAIIYLMPEGGKALPIISVTAAASWFWVLPRSVAAIDAADRLQEAQDQWAKLEEEWRGYAGPEVFRSVRQSLDSIKHNHDQLPEERKTRIATLMANRRVSQHQQHLDSFAIESMRIVGIGKSKVATLLSYGVCTAGDIRPERIQAIPGFGPKTIANMIAAREACSRTFLFDQGRALAPYEIATVDNELALQRRKFRKELQEGLLKLKAVAATGARRSCELSASAAANAPFLAQALADVHAAGSL